MQAGKRTIRDVFNRGRNLEIPFFQRSYVWDTEQWERFYEDMKLISKEKNNYFFGSVILKQQETNSKQDAKLTVIDGQQRLTTMNIFLKVLALKMNANDSFVETFTKQRDKSIILLHNHNDIDSFNQIVNLQELQEFEDDINDKIIRAYNFFKKKIKVEEINENGGLSFFNILDNIIFVGIDLASKEDEQQIFDTINSLGVRLTTAELLKNYLFNRNELPEFNEFWRDVFEKDDDTKNYWDKTVTTGRLKRTFIDLFFYSFFQIKIQDSSIEIKAEDRYDFTKVENLFESYKKLIADYKVDRLALVKEIKEYANLFKKNFNHSLIEKEINKDFGIERINVIIFGLETSTLIPYVLYVLKNVEDEDVRNEIFEFVESYIIRRIIVKATSKNYNQLFSDRLISNKILSKNDLKDFIEKRSDKVNFNPSDDDLKKGFNESILINKQAAGVIYFIESKIRDRNRQATQLLGIKKYSLEHLMPKKWENNWGRLNDPKQREERNRLILTLGNLAIITQSLNASIRDSAWKIKKNGNGKRYGLTNYSGGIETLAPYLEFEEWNEETIKTRANELYEKAIQIWKS